MCVGGCIDAQRRIPLQACVISDYAIAECDRVIKKAPTRSAVRLLQGVLCAKVKWSIRTGRCDHRAISAQLATGHGIWPKNGTNAQRKLIIKVRLGESLRRSLYIPCRHVIGQFPRLSKG